MSYTPCHCLQTFFFRSIRSGCLTPPLQFYMLDRKSCGYSYLAAWEWYERTEKTRTLGVFFKSSFIIIPLDFYGIDVCSLKQNLLAETSMYSDSLYIYDVRRSFVRPNWKLIRSVARVNFQYTIFYQTFQMSVNKFPNQFSSLSSQSTE